MKKYIEPIRVADHKWTAEEIEEVLNGLPKLKLHGYEHKRMRCSEFLDKFLTELNMKYSTREVIEENGLEFESGAVQCQAGRGRSATDLYRMMKYYYPRTMNIKTFCKVLGKLSEENKLSGGICNDVKRRVYYSHGKCNCTATDEFGLTFSELVELGK